MGDLTRARTYWNKVIDLFGVAPLPGRDSVPAPQPSDDAARRRTEPEAKQGMADAYEWLVELGLRLGNTEEAEKFSALCLARQRELATVDARNVRATKSLGFALYWAGSVSLRKGEFLEAGRFFDESLRLFEKLAEIDRGNAEASSSLASAMLHAGDFRLAAGDLGVALKRYNESLNTRQSLATATRRTPTPVSKSRPPSRRSPRPTRPPVTRRPLSCSAR